MVRRASLSDREKSECFQVEALRPWAQAGVWLARWHGSLSHGHRTTRSAASERARCCSPGWLPVRGPRGMYFLPFAVEHVETDWATPDDDPSGGSRRLARNRPGAGRTAASSAFSGGSSATHADVGSPSSPTCSSNSSHQPVTVTSLKTASAGSLRSSTCPASTRERGAHTLA